MVVCGFSEFNLEAIENTQISNKGHEHNPMLPERLWVIVWFIIHPIQVKRGDSMKLLPSLNTKTTPLQVNHVGLDFGMVYNCREIGRFATCEIRTSKLPHNY